MVRFAFGAPLRRLATAVALLLTMCSSAVSVVAHTAGDLDAECVWLVAHDASAHTFTAASNATPAADHCLACHASRTFRPDLDGGPVARPAAEPVRLTPAKDTAIRSAATIDLPPLRAPPTA
jgi:hypothetical protein